MDFFVLFASDHQSSYYCQLRYTAQTSSSLDAFGIDILTSMDDLALVLESRGKYKEVGEMSDGR